MIQQDQWHHFWANNRGNPHPTVLSGQEIFEKVFFAGVEPAPDINDYPPEEIETCHHSTSNNDATIVTLVSSALYRAVEARDASNNKQEGRKNKLTTQEQP